MGSAYILTIGIEIGCGVRALDGAEGFDLNSWKNGVAMNESGKKCSLSRFRAGMGKKNPDFHFERA